jgi:TrmH family RNA methyltransferase
MLSKEKQKELSRLKTKKGRKDQGRFLIEGLRLCEEAVEFHWPIQSVLFTNHFALKGRGKSLLKKMQKLNVNLIPVKNQTIAKLSDTKTSQGIVCVVKKRGLSLEDLWEGNVKVILALDGIRDPGNVGTLVRTADAFGVSAVLLSKDTVELYNPKVVRSTMGSIFHLSVFDEVDLEKTIPELKKRKLRIMGTEVKEGIKLDKFRPSGKVCLLIGNEAEGLSKELLKLCDEVVHIPSYGRAESLNVAVAGGIILYELTKRRIRF